MTNLDVLVIMSVKIKIRRNRIDNIESKTPAFSSLSKSASGSI